MIADNHAWLAERSRAAANRWRDSLLRAIDGLADAPGRHPLAPEADEYPGVLRQMLHGRRRSVYHILFEVTDAAVIVARVRHSSQDFIAPDDLSPAG